MEASILKKAGEFLKEKSRRKYWLTAVTALSIAVIFATVQILMSPARAMVGGTYCGKEEHEHTEECYELVLICGYDEQGLPVQQDPKPAPEDEPTEGAQESAENVQESTEEAQESTENAQEPVGEVHELSEEVTNAAGAPHVHDDSCYIVESVLVCQLEETEGHVHTEECYATIQTLICDEGTEALTAQDDSQPADSELEEADGGSTEPEEDSTDGTAESEEGETAESEEHETDETAEFEENEAKDSEESETDETVEPEENEAEGSEENETDEAADAEEGESDEAGEMVEPHVHTDECYMRVLVCEKEEHKHTNKCYEDPDTLVYYCEYEVHEHTEECYDENGSLVCGRADFVVHTHTEDCYNARGELVCPLPEIEAHVHTEECYGRTKDGETESHTHTEECYDGNGELICGEPEEPTALEEDVSEEPAELTCGREEIELHTHTGECYDEDGALICGRLEVLEHVHSAECRIEPEIEEFTYYCLESIHEHTEECYDENGSLICGKADYAVHTHTRKCYGVDGTLICPLPELEAHVHTEECYPDGAAEPVCGKEEIVLHTHTEECYDENGVLICGRLEVLEHVHSEDCKVSHKPVIRIYEGENFIVTATYKADANIPEEALFRVVQITEESDEEHYARRQAQYAEIAGEESSPMRVLLKIGFYVDGKEVEPETPVSITVQMLDENGMEDGEPVTVIHFKGEDVQVLDGSDAENSSTTFEMDHFSEIAIGYGPKEATDKTVQISESVEYEDEAFHISFRLEGEVTIPADLIVDEGVVLDKEETQPVEEEENEAPEENEAGEDSVHETPESPEGENTESSAEAAESESAGYEEENSTEEGVFSSQIENEELEKNLEFRLKAMEEGSDEYTAVETYGEEIGDGGEELLLQVWAYSLNYKDVELDLSDCVVTAEITPTQALVDAAKEAAAVMADGQEDIDNPDADPEDWLSGGIEHQDGFTIAVMSLSAESEIEEIQTTTVEGQAEPMVLTLDSGFFAARASGQPNPKFTVQFYANLEVVAYNDPALRKVIGSTSYTNELPVIDTSGGKLPANGGGSTASPNGNEIRNLYVDMTTGKLQTKTELTEVYSSRPFEYYKAPTINYMNALVENPNYELKEVWVLKEGREADSTDRNDWDIHTYSADLHFTNRAVSAESGEYVLISDGATLRFVYDTTDNDNEFEVAFYDYDIGDGMIYSTQLNAQKQTNGKPTSTQGSGTYHMHTDQSGINSPGNYTGSGAKLAFGNSNTGSGLQHELWGGNLLNKANQTQSGHPSVTGSYKGCTFGLVTGLVDGKIQYAGNVNAPNLFNDGSAAGKTSYDNGEFSLTFNRVGDTYTLTTVNGTGTEALDTFNHPSPNASTVHNHIWTNNFWPMDSAASFGTDGHDMKFGDYTNRENYKFAGQAGSSGGSAAANGTFPWSDDGEDHNSYFGMHYAVEFDLVEDYVGPLEYYFFGDDDMWVFLDGRLVCDIGGVHSSVGEYVNLWDYIDRKKLFHDHTDECYDEDGNLTCGYHIHTDKCYDGDGNLICGYHDHTDECYDEGGKLTCNHRVAYEKKAFTLSFFYTERGESGSTCWMQFTLPSVSSLTPETNDEDYGHLKIEKTVTMIEGGKGEIAKDNNDEFTFTVHFTDVNGKNLPDDYSYVKYDKDGNEIGADLIIWDGGEFTLKNGEFIIVRYLPQGTKYKITESNTALTVMDNTSEESKIDYYTDITVGDTLADDKKDLDNDKTAEGSISEGSTSEVKYNNKFYHYSLPETGGTGTILYTMAGTITILFGAGFLYRKKFRERRGERG